MNKHHLATA